MTATKKIDALTVKEVHARCASLEPSLALETVYRWRTALVTGKGISDDRKMLLIRATADSPDPLQWADFEPLQEAAHVRSREDVQ